jgi:hypothetical protein
VIWNRRLGTSLACNKKSPEDAQPEFSTGLEVLEWLVTKEENPLKDATPTLERENIIEPPGNALGPEPHSSKRPDVIRQRTAQQLCKNTSDAILQQQQEMNTVMTRERVLRAHEKKQKVGAENRKRKSASSDGPAAKKARREAQADARDEVQAEYEKNRAAQQEELNRRKADFEIGKWKVAKHQTDAALAAQKGEALQAQDEKLLSLSEKQRERRGKEIEVHIVSEHEERERQEEMIKEMRIKERNLETAQKSLQPVPRVTTLNEDEMQRLLDERDVRAKKQEEYRRKKAALKKRCQEARTQREEDENEDKGAAAAVKKVAGPAKDDLAALDKLVADAKETNIEERVLQFIAEMKLATELRQKAAAAAEARAKAMKRERLFEERYVCLPAQKLRLHASGNVEPCQGFEPPKKKTPAGIPNFRFLSQGVNLDNLTDEYWQTILEYAKQLSLQPSTPPGSSCTGEGSVDRSKLTAQQQMDLAVKRWMLKQIGDKNLEDQTVSKALIERMKDSVRERGARERLELKAKVEGSNE